MTTEERDAARLRMRLASRNPEDNRFGAGAPTLHPKTCANLDLPTWMRRGMKIREVIP